MRRRIRERKKNKGRGGNNRELGREPHCGPVRAQYEVSACLCVSDAHVRRKETAKEATWVMHPAGGSKCPAKVLERFRQCCFFVFFLVEVFESISANNTDVSVLLCSCRVLRSAQPGLAEPPGEEEAGLHPRAHRYRRQIRDRPADSAGGNRRMSC